jgi:hypothetical protein
MTVLYIHLDYDAFKALEAAAKAWKETQHTTTPPGFYHKSVRLPIGPDTIIEFHGPLVGGAGHEAGGKPGLTFKDSER